MRVSPFTASLSVGLEPRRVFQHSARFALLYSVALKLQQLTVTVKLATKHPTRDLEGFQHTDSDDVRSSQPIHQTVTRA